MSKDHSLNLQGVEVEGLLNLAPSSGDVGTASFIDMTLIVEFNYCIANTFQCFYIA